MFKFSIIVLMVLFASLFSVYAQVDLSAPTPEMIVATATVNPETISTEIPITDTIETMEQVAPGRLARIFDALVALLNALPAVIAIIALGGGAFAVTEGIVRNRQFKDVLEKLYLSTPAETQQHIQQMSQSFAETALNLARLLEALNDTVKEITDGKQRENK